MNGTTSEIGICTDNYQYLCLYEVNFKDIASKCNVFNGSCLCKKTLHQCLRYEGQ